MNLVDSSKLLQERVKKAVALINALRRDNNELSDRLKMVLNHNEELQVLLNASGADNAQVEEAITGALSELDALDIENIGDFGTLDAGELEAAESFTIEGSTADIETFEDNF